MNNRYVYLVGIFQPTFFPMILIIMFENNVSQFYLLKLTNRCKKIKQIIFSWKNVEIYNF